MQSSPAHSNPDSDPFTAGGGGGMFDSSDSLMVKTESEEDEDELSFMKKLYSADWERYCYQKDMIRCRPPFCDSSIVYWVFHYKYDSYENQSYPIVQPRDLDGGVKHYSFDELMQMTRHFRYTRICYTMFGTLHRGTIQTESGSLDVLVKTWEYFYPILCDYQVLHHTHRIHDELNLLRDHEIRSHRNVVKLIGFHCARRLAVIYEDRHDELLENIIPTGPPWSMKHDIFAYGILLLELINKNLYAVFKMSTLMEEEFFNCNLSDPKTSAVDDSFCVDEDIAMEFTKLAVDCLGFNSDEQPTMQCIVRVLKDLKLRCLAKKRQISG